ncbi:RsmB/NOP family class I SAM-dependent RNA methyltransferase [Pediococcus siamensis]|uniref:RsmB/NOP family class I SAM-dependent RNA methyltransferase n=1 Tax=Pediococcus siamensis TaxID=381829 RepID=UPI0039A2E167
MQLPTAFIQKYTELLGEEAPAFLAAFEEQPTRGFRVNPLKGGQTPTAHTLKEPVQYCSFGYYGAVDGKTLDHQSGLIYSQEPSAMYVGEVAHPQPQDRVLDLCAAPGGKTTHLASFMAQGGLLVSNEINRKRAEILAENVERFGLQNTVVTNESPDSLEKYFPEFFNVIVVDAPCSGEGMFRKDHEAVQYWTPDYPASCANRQKKILQSALKMLRPGGRLIYSTCTFAPEEDEQNMAWLLQNYPDMQMVPIKKFPGMQDGRPEWADGNPQLKAALRLFPHQVRGEGHFIAQLQKADGQMQVKAPKPQKTNLNRQQKQDWHKVEGQILKTPIPESRLLVFGDYLYAMPANLPQLANLQVVRPGVNLGRYKKNRFEPGLPLALANQPEAFVAPVQLTQAQWENYVHGDTFTVSEVSNGWHVLVCRGLTVGFGKVVNGTVKNFYPKKLRFAVRNK